MEALIPFLLIALTVFAVIGGIAYSHFANKKRRETIKQLAEEMGLSFHPEGSPQLLAEHGGFNLFNRGRARKMRNLTEGVTDEVRIAIFDYQFTTGSGKNKRTTRQTVASLTSPKSNCPGFSMRPQGVFDRIGGMLGFQDIDFDSHPEFSKLFVLKGQNEEAIRAFFKPELLEFFQSQRGVSVEGHGQTMCFFRSGKTVKPPDLKELLAEAYEVFGYLVDP